MTAFRRLALIVVVLLLLAIGGVAWYFLGTSGRPAAGMVPGDTLAFALVPNGATMGVGYDESKLKTLVEAPQAQPLLDSIEKLIGDKNLALLHLLGPELSGQSFIALTHLDPAHPNETGFIAGMHPKLGTDHFDEFVQQVNAAYPDLAKETKTGRDTLLGVGYQWIEGTQGQGRVCVARYKGWILTAWGEASLQDCLERLQGKSSTPSLAENADYKKSLDRVGSGSQAFVYANYPKLGGLIAQHLSITNPAAAASFQKRLASVGGAAIGTSFEHGEIVDRFSILEPKQAQIDAGLAPGPCPFDTLKFTGPDTRLYFAGNFNWPQMWTNIQEQIGASPSAMGKGLLDQINAYAQAGGIDVQKNIIDALGPESSVQLEWPADATWPDLAIYFKIDKPDDFKPAIAALVAATRKEFAASGVINEMESDGHHFATLKMINPMPVSPTILEDGPWFGLFLNETHAVRSMARDESRGLLHNDDFNRQIGSQRESANQLVFLDTPRLLDQVYRTALPWVNMGAMLNPKLAALVQGHNLPPDLTWLGPMGTWSAVSRTDDDGLTGFSTSGAGNQGILLGSGLVAAVLGAQQVGLLPQTRVATPIPGYPVGPATPGATPGSVQVATPVMPATPPASPTPPDATTPPGSTH